MFGKSLLTAFISFVIFSNFAFANQDCAAALSDPEISARALEFENVVNVSNLKASAAGLLSSQHPVATVEATLQGPQKESFLQLINEQTAPFFAKMFELLATLQIEDVVFGSTSFPEMEVQHQLEQMASQFHPDISAQMLLEMASTVTLQALQMLDGPILLAAAEIRADMEDEYQERLAEFLEDSKHEGDIFHENRANNRDMVDMYDRAVRAAKDEEVQIGFQAQ